MTDVLDITEQLQKMADLSTDVDVINTGLKAIDEIERLRAEVEQLRAALAFYADKDTWRSSTIYMCGHIGETRASMDKGEKARAAAALKETGDE